eukprot:762756-Hanusia_phi.AAC.2
MPLTSFPGVASSMLLSSAPLQLSPFLFSSSASSCFLFSPFLPSLSHLLFSPSGPFVSSSHHQHRTVGYIQHQHVQRLPGSEAA